MGSKETLQEGKADEALAQGAPAPAPIQYATMAFCIIGIVGTLMVYAVLQERIMTMPYGEEGVHFSASLFIVLIPTVNAKGFGEYSGFEGDNYKGGWQDGMRHGVGRAGAAGCRGVPS